MKYAGSLGRLLALGGVLVSVVLVGVGWYGYFVLERIDFVSFVIVSLFFGSCALVGVIYVMVKRPEEETFFIGAPQRLSHAQHMSMAIASLVFACGGLWFALKRDIHRSLGGKILLVVAFFFFLACAVLYLWQSRKRSP